MSVFASICLIVLCSLMARAQLSFVTYIPGNCSVILTIPHGGSVVKTADHGRLPRRYHGCYNGLKCNWLHNCTTGPRCGQKCKVRLLKDLYTKEIGLEMASQLESKIGAKPHVVIMKLRRNVVDAQRALLAGTAGNAVAILAYKEFHQTLESIINAMTEPGLLVDIHGHTRKHGRVELGYRVTKDMLNQNLAVPAGFSTLRYLEKLYPDKSILDLIRGNNGIGAMLERLGYPTMPSPSYRRPLCLPYVAGGFITWKYSRRKGRDVDAVQVSMPEWTRNAENGTAMADALTTVISQWWKSHYVSTANP